MIPRITKMIGRVDDWFCGHQRDSVGRGHSGSLSADPEAYFLMVIALPFGSTRALATAQDISRSPPCVAIHPRACVLPSLSRRSASGDGRYLRSGSCPPNADFAEYMQLFALTVPAAAAL